MYSVESPWRQTLSMPPLEIEPGSPASQAGTLPKELSRQLIHWLFGTSDWPGGERPPILFRAAPVHVYTPLHMDFTHKYEGWGLLSSHGLMTFTRIDSLITLFRTSTWPGGKRPPILYNTVHTIKLTKIVAVWATTVRFWFWKQVQIRETILIKMRQESSKSDKIWPRPYIGYILWKQCQWSCSDKNLILNKKIELYTKDNAITLFFAGFYLFAHYFNKNCLTVLILYSKSKSDHCSSVGIVFKVWNQKFVHHFDENCLTIPNLFLKSKSDYSSSNGNNFGVRHWISEPKLSRVDDSSCHFLGGAVFSQPFIWQYIKKHSTDGHGRCDLELGYPLGKI
jgi:hypothetical protein